MVQTLWHPQYLTTLQASTACHRNSFTFTLTIYHITWHHIREGLSLNNCHPENLRPHTYLSHQYSVSLIVMVTCNRPEFENKYSFLHHILLQTIMYPVDPKGLQQHV
jgi:hypothetical protein